MRTHDQNLISKPYPVLLALLRDNVVADFSVVLHFGMLHDLQVNVNIGDLQFLHRP